MIRRLLSRLFPCRCPGCRVARGEAVFRPQSTHAEPGVVWVRFADGQLVALSPRDAQAMGEQLRDAARWAVGLAEFREKVV